MYVGELLTEDDREDHIFRHGVTLAEVREVIFGVHFARRVRDNRYEVTGQAESGRFLTVISALRADIGVFALVTARESTLRERRRLPRRS